MKKKQTIRIARQTNNTTATQCITRLPTDYEVQSTDLTPREARNVRANDGRENE